MKKGNEVIYIREAGDATENGVTTIWMETLIITSFGKKQGTAILKGSDQKKQKQLYTRDIGRTLFLVTDKDKAIDVVRNQIRERMESFLNKTVKSWITEKYAGWESMANQGEMVKKALNTGTWKATPVIDKTQDWIEKGWSI